MCLYANKINGGAQQRASVITRSADEPTKRKDIVGKKENESRNRTIEHSNHRIRCACTEAGKSILREGGISGPKENIARYLDKNEDIFWFSVEVK